MSKNTIQVCTAKTLDDVFYHLKTMPGLVVAASCTNFKTLPEKLLSIQGMKELSDITKNEQFIEIGSAVVLSKIAALKTKIPQVLYSAIESVATPQIRNLITIGGNICCNPIKGTLFAPLLALDARLTLQNKEESLSIPLSKFTNVLEGHILTKIRVPTEDWDIQEFKRLGPSNKLTQDSASYVFLARVENSILTGVRFAFAGPIAFRSIELENRMVGSRLPLEAKTVSSLITEASLQFDKIATENSFTNPLIKEEFLRLVTYSFKKIS